MHWVPCWTQIPDGPKNQVGRISQHRADSGEEKLGTKDRWGEKGPERGSDTSANLSKIPEFQGYRGNLEVFLDLCWPLQWAQVRVEPWPAWAGVWPLWHAGPCWGQSGKAAAVICCVDHSVTCSVMLGSVKYAEVNLACLLCSLWCSCWKVSGGLGACAARPCGRVGGGQDADTRCTGARERALGRTGLCV